MIKIKICGITNLEDAQHAVACGAWALGFIFYKKSPRYISPFKARSIIEKLPPFVTPVGVFVDQREGAIKEIAGFAGITTIQLHGDESPALCQRLRQFILIKALRVDEKFNPSNLGSYPVQAFLFDAYQEGVPGGTGRTFNWEILRDKKFPKPVILSGGLNPDNVQEALRTLRLYAVDVSSGVEESPGKKSKRLVEGFCKNAKDSL